MNLPSGSKILEIGCGWGGFIEHASEQGHQVVGLTISNEQLDYAKQEMQSIEIQKSYLRIIEIIMGSMM